MKRAAGKSKKGTAATNKTKRSGATKLRATPSGDVSVKVDASLKKAWDSLSKRVDAAAQSGASAFDELWETVGEIVNHEPPLYVVGGYKNAAAFLSDRLKVDARTAQRNMRVAKFASPTEEAEFGITNLDLALAYLEAKTGPIKGRVPVDFDKLKIPVVTESGTKMVAFREATGGQIQAATRALLAKSGKAPRSLVQAAIEKKFSGVSTLKTIAVHETNGYVSFQRVPVAALSHFARAVSGVELSKVK
ncbi:MAG: hypothetical protein ACRELY_16340 [Polyangiaceae bacterium]